MCVYIICIISVYIYMYIYIYLNICSVFGRNNLLNLDSINVYTYINFCFPPHGTETTFPFLSVTTLFKIKEMTNCA